ncbi:MAG: protein-L-isoaspartate(D-aspartate) O-methyltransferase [Myxococcales bacterium]|nr:protein-L-isoaspartate(D-aspartate) O-methyltransferase [Myxococcales bacterium]
MVREQLETRGITNARVLDAMRTVPRERFVTQTTQDAYGDFPLPIGHRQTISQPYIVALMTQLADVRAGDRVLEVGTGSGYQTAVLCALGAEVWSVEIIAELAMHASALLEELGYSAHIKHADGHYGWPEHAPFDAIVITAAPERIPQRLVAQLGLGGRMVVPVGDAEQRLRVVRRTATGLDEQESIPVRFVPMTGEALSQPVVPGQR